MYPIRRTRKNVTNTNEYLINGWDTSSNVYIYIYIYIYCKTLRYNCKPSKCTTLEEAVHGEQTQFTSCVQKPEYYATFENS